MRDNRELIKLMRIFLLICAIILCVAGTAVGVVQVTEKSKSADQTQMPIKIEDAFADAFLHR